MKSLSFFPKSHLLLAGTLALLLASFLLANSVERATDKRAQSGHSAPANDAVDADHEASDSAAPAAPDGTAAAPAEALPPSPATTVVAVAPESVDEPPPEFSTATEIVRAGDSMARIFQRQSLSPRTLHAVLDSGPLARRLRNIHPGHQLDFVVTGDNDLISMTYTIDALNSWVFERDGDTFTAQEVAREPERVLAFRQGTINNSLFLASRALGLNEAITLRFAQIFQWDIDFVLDIRAGDEFSLMFEEKYLDGEFIGYGHILAAQFTNRGRVYRAVRYVDEAGTASYYTPEGRNMRKAFLRAPLEFTRISSNFNPRRLHPIHNRVTPHRGIDYAAPTGTPVMAAGDGRVRTAGRTTPNGNYIVLQHGEQFQTKYLHLSRFARGITAGARVRQGQVIGYVGATGWATAPHLHYEFLVNGVHRNPRTVDLPNANPVPRQELTRFHRNTAALLAMLDSEQQLLRVAQNQ